MGGERLGARASAPIGMAQTEPGWDILLYCRGPSTCFTFWYYAA